MPELIATPFVVPGVEPKLIEEYVGAINTWTPSLSVARMVAPGGRTRRRFARPRRPSTTVLRHEGE